MLAVWLLTTQRLVPFKLGARAAQNRAWTRCGGRIYLGRCGQDQFRCGYTALTGVFLHGILTGLGDGQERR